MLRLWLTLCLHIMASKSDRIKAYTKSNSPSGIHVRYGLLHSTISNDLNNFKCYLPVMSFAVFCTVVQINSSRFIDMQSVCNFFLAFSALTPLVGRQEGHPACKKTEWCGTGVVICLEQGADLHMAQLMLLPLTVSCSSKIQIGFTFLVPAYPGCPGKEAVKWL